MLESYVSLNMEAFRKIVKKHDKLTGWQTQETYMRGLRELRIFHDDETRAIRSQLENAYLKIEEVLCALEPDRWRKAARGYRGRRNTRVGPRRAGILRGSSTTKRVAGEVATRRTRGFDVARVDATRTIATVRRRVSVGRGDRDGRHARDARGRGVLERRAPRVVRRGGRVAPAIRFPLLVALHAGLYGVLVRAWSDTRVNAPFIFGAKRGTELTATGAVLAGSLAACAWCVVAIVLVARAATSESRRVTSRACSSPRS